MSIDLERHHQSRGPHPGRSRVIRIITGLALTAILFLTAFLGVKWLASEVRDVIGGPTEATAEPGLPVTFVVEPGAPASQIARDLADAGVVQSAAAFDRVVREQRASDRLQAGEYQLETGMDPSAVLDVLLEGPTSDVYRLTIVEGLTVGQMLESIERQTGIPLADLSRPLLDGTVTSSLHEAEPETLQDWEGLLFPDTYEFDVDAGAVEIVDRLVTTAEQRIGAIDWSYLEELEMTPYDGLIIASLIEREALLDEDRPLVASVIYNRLAIDMRLQLDATVVYALGGLPEGGLTLDDLQVESPYNTYLNGGLPPTPISGVGVASLRAAADPADTEFLFFLARDDSGKFSYTDDFDEFLQWQQEDSGS